jgi:hypothetical protein
MNQLEMFDTRTTAFLSPIEVGQLPRLLALRKSRPAGPLAVTDKAQVFFGDPTIKEAGIIVDWSGLVPGSIGLYQLNLRVPGAHIKGDALPATIRIGGVDSAKTGPAIPHVAVE